MSSMLALLLAIGSPQGASADDVASPVEWTESATRINCKVGPVPTGTAFGEIGRVKHDRAFDLRIKNFSKKMDEKFVGRLDHRSDIEVSDPTDILIGFGDELINFDGPAKGFTITTFIPPFSIIMKFDYLSLDREMKLTTYLAKSKGDEGVRKDVRAFYLANRLGGQCVVSEHVSQIEKGGLAQ